MKRENRLKKNWEFQEVISSKKQIVTKNLILYYKDSSKFEIGISVPKKFAIASLRNFFRRQIKSILDKNIKFNELKYKNVLILRKSFLSLSFQEKEKEIIKIYERLGNGKEKK
ncbi:ribonuclease P protein component [Mesomycoplasma molare]|uniref:Ribonuclease P protein component n=1 Tax=Mesomycoplasma molare TaxID=171288 RepID=A0ABY5TU63_9BACT|nr:ribonuclease P protein component [Mesomycoplasma molare]UWD34207.1 ribonuclease P protein component [Mesomycoplasma molare]